MTNKPIMDQKVIDSLYAFRSALAHSYSFVHESPIKKGLPPRYYWFSLDPSASCGDTIVKVPTSAWKGPKYEITDDTTTIVYLVSLKEFVETMTKKVRQLAENHQLGVRLNGGIQELWTRYSIVVTSPSNKADGQEWLSATTAASGSVPYGK